METVAFVIRFVPIVAIISSIQMWLHRANVCNREAALQHAKCRPRPAKGRERPIEINGRCCYFRIGHAGIRKSFEQDSNRSRSGPSALLDLPCVVY